MVSIKEVQIFPYYPEVDAEAAPVLHGGLGQYVSGQLMNHQYHHLQLSNSTHAEELKIGATYSWSGIDENGEPISSHWLYAISNMSAPALGVTLDWSLSGRASPILVSPEHGLIYLEALRDIVAVKESPTQAYRHTQMQLGRTGWLVMSALTAPASIGVLIEKPALPSQITEGADGITIVAQSSRTLQSINLRSLSCVTVRTSALLMRVVRY